MSRTWNVRSHDGTLLRAWTNEGEGPTVLLCNGLGTVPSSWPGLIRHDSGFRVVTWYQRGTFASARPVDLSRLSIADHAGDALAVLDAAGGGDALVASWSIGVNVAFEVERQAPERVRGLLAVAGIPGGTFASMGAPLGLPGPLSAPVAVTAARAARLAGPALTGLSAFLPIDARLAWLLRHSGFLRPQARTEHLVPMLQEFLRQDWAWYMRLAHEASRHRPMDLAQVDCPTTFLAGSSDVLTSAAAVREAASRIPGAEVEVLAGSHFLPLEHPERLQQALRELHARAEPASRAG